VGRVWPAAWVAWPAYPWQAAPMARSVLAVLSVILGATIVIATLLSAVKTVILPRAVGSLVTRILFLSVFKVFWSVAKGRRFAWRDRIMAYYSPVALVLMPGVWVALVIAGFTFVYWGTGVHPLREAYLTSGSSMLTLGVVFHRPLPHATLSMAEATLGLGLVALMISYLPSIYAAFGRREVLVGKLETRAGTPPSPVELLSRYSRIGFLADIDEELFARWEDWFMDVEESHTSLPALVFFRSPQPERSWVTAAGCVLDTAAIVASTLDRPRSPRAEVMLRTGFFALRRVADYFAIDHDPNPKPDDPITVTRREFDLMCVELEAAGVALKRDRDRAWESFAGWRVNYDRALVALAAMVDAPPARWSSDRIMPEQKVRLLRGWRRERE
jgi:hypothetical protein